MISLLHSGHRIKHCLFHISLLLRICSFLDPKGPNVCPRRATTEVNGTITVLERTIIECCPDYKYVEQSDTCQECPAGRYGRNCENTCLPSTYGMKCSKVCSCSEKQHCDPKNGCICNAGYTGPECNSVCQEGYYGENCQKACVCANNAKCHPMSGHCVCPAGWIGQFCIERCVDGFFGANCSHICDCQTDDTCDPETGRCIDDDLTERINEPVKKHQSSLTVYILMAAAVTGLVVLVAVVIKVKEAITSSFMVSKMVTNQVPAHVHDQTNVTSRSGHEQTIWTTTSIDDAPEDIYCEIDEFQ